jgi:2-methylisocitrate lyase-like PEP mutase family enzyme
MASTNGTGPKSAATRLRELLARKDEILLCPGVYDGLTARIALREGFDCLYMVRLFNSLYFPFYANDT